MAYGELEVSDLDRKAATRNLAGGIERETEKEREIRRSKERYDLSQTFANIGTWDWDIKSGDLYWSERIAPLFGHEAGSLETSYDNFLAAIHPEDRDAVVQAIGDCIEKGVEYSIEHRVVWPDGTVRWLLEQGDVVRDDQGDALNMLGVVQDITLRKQAEDDLKDTLRELRETQQFLIESEKLASLGGLVAGIAHEINTPIGIGVTASTHLRESVDRFCEQYRSGSMKRADLEAFVSTAEQSSTIIEANLHRASDLIRSFKQVAVDQSNDNVHQFALGQYVKELLVSLKPKLRDRATNVALDIDAAIAVEASPGTISQILTNLIVNSLTHAFDERESGNITIAACVDGENLVLDYCDDGCGMDPETAGKIFEPFFTTKRGSGGSGLGMHIVHNLVTGSLGGQISCDSTPGQGTRFKIKFPRNKIGV